MTNKYVGGGGDLNEHRQIARKAFGGPLPSTAVVHHVDGNGHNNSHDNLVICPNESYHKLLHIRQAALDASGNPNWRKCTHCQEYDDIANLKKLPSLSESYYHRACDSARRRQYNHDKGIAKRRYNV